MLRKLFPWDSSKNSKKDGKSSVRKVFNIGQHAVTVSLMASDETIPLERWQLTDARLWAVANQLVQSAAADAQSKESMQFLENSCSIPHEFVKDLSLSDAEALGLPALTNLALEIKPEGLINEDSFVLKTAWIRPNGQVAYPEIIGSFLNHQSEWRRISAPALAILELAQLLARPTAQTERFQVLSQVSAKFPDGDEPWLKTDGYLGKIRIHYASRMSLKLSELTPEKTNFDPVLFGAARSEDDENPNEQLDEDNDNILGHAAQKLFAEDRFRRDSNARSVYLLKDGAYVFVDPNLRPVLNAVRRFQDAPEAKRRELVLNPRRVLTEAIGEEGLNGANLEGLFVETEQFSERVAGVDVWRKQVLPWLIPSEKNRWLPERFGLRIDDTFYSVSAENAGPLVLKVEEAAATSIGAVDVTEFLDSVDPTLEGSGSESSKGTSEGEGAAEKPRVMLPLTPQAIQSVELLRPFAATPSSPEADVQEKDSKWASEREEAVFLIVKENFEEVSYGGSGEAGTSIEVQRSTIHPPENLRAVLKPHQQEGLEWLCHCLASGRPGALLADDMGLGKTVQALAFMSWLRNMQIEHRQSCRILIVAPTGLLGNWRAEIDRHLSEPRLGQLIDAHGQGLKWLRDIRAPRIRDTHSGRANLDLAEWANDGVVLTTYETLRDYHFSFAKIPFDLIVYDEAQKLKNPTSQMTRAAKTLQARFALALTGTPVENRLQDLWSIFDVVAPGLLGSSRSFETRHAPENKGALQALKSKLTDGSDTKPAYLLRRMKSDALKGLPKKHVHNLQQAMPTIQAELYRELVTRAAAASAQSKSSVMLTTLAEMRGCSLHPVDPVFAGGDLDSYAAQSARLSIVLKILDEISEKREKVLIFLEDLNMQAKLASLLHRRFALAKQPSIINGTVPGAKRQQMVDEFQNAGSGFGVMILSPRAGGVGLTITAANHVVHLSRWWNPAVEDQATDRVYRIGQTRDVHVYIPMAVHPDPLIEQSSFDLRLNTLIERKRSLTRDLFSPPEATESDLADLLREVANEGPLPDEAAFAAPDPDPTVQSSEVTSDQPRVTLSAPIYTPQAKVWPVRSGQTRPIDEILAPFAGREIARVEISDPYALVDEAARLAQADFVRDLARIAKGINQVIIEYNDRKITGYNDSLERSDMNTKLLAAVRAQGTRVELRRRTSGGQNGHFHDRRVSIDVQRAGSGTSQHTLFFGMGLLALYDLKFECNVSYAPPTTL